MGQVTVGKWGDTLVVGLPGEVVQAIGLQDGEQVDVSTADGEIVIRRAQPKYTLEQLFKGRMADEWRAAYADAYDWGPDLGREIIAK